MVRVVATSDCLEFTGGLMEFDVEATTVRGMITALDCRFPGFGTFVDQRMAIAIDGEIHQDAWFAPLNEGNEVFLIPKIAGG